MTATIAFRRIQAGDPVAIAPLLALLGSAPICAWLENPRAPDGIRLRDNLATSDLPALVETWPEGRFFTLEADVRWEHLSDGAVWVVVIADEIDAAEVRGPISLTPVRDTEDHLLLWGTRTDRGWREDRIPADLNTIYPASWDGPHAAIVSREYEVYANHDWELDVRRVTRYLSYDGSHRPVEPDPLPQLEE